VCSSCFISIILSTEDNQQSFIFYTSSNTGNPFGIDGRKEERRKKKEERNVTMSDKLDTSSSVPPIRGVDLSGMKSPPPPPPPPPPPTKSSHSA
jgi:hypothetical protein